MATITFDFTEVATGPEILVRHGETFTYDVAGTYEGTVVVEKSVISGIWEQLASATDASAGATLRLDHPSRGNSIVRMRCTVFTSGTIETSLADGVDATSELKDSAGNASMQVIDGGVQFAGTVVRPAQKYLIPAAGLAKVGAGSGFLVAAADNVALVTCPASETAATLVIPVVGLKVGMTITGFHLVGQIESAANTVTVDADLRKHTAAAADVSDASVGSITQLSVVADTIMSDANTAKTGLSEVVGANESFYILITATTGASTDIALQGAAVIVTEA